MATRDPQAKPITLIELIERLKAIDAAQGIERAKLARELSKSSVVEVSLGAAGDEGIWQATRPRGLMTYREAAQALAYASLSGVGDAVSRVNRRRRGEL